VGRRMPRAEQPGAPALQSPLLHEPTVGAAEPAPAVDRSVEVSKGLKETQSLKAQLAAQGLSTKGSKAELKARLAADRSNPDPETTVSSASYLEFVAWLSAIGLERYAADLRSSGCDKLVVLSAMTDADFAYLMTQVTMKRPHARAFENAFHELRDRIIAVHAGSSGAAVTSAQRPPPNQPTATTVSATPVVAPQTATLQPIAPPTGVTPVVVATMPTFCNCNPRCKSLIVHQRLVDRARQNGVTTSVQRKADADKRGTERLWVSLMVLLGYAGWYSTQCDTFCSECADPEFQTCPGLQGCPTPRQCDGCGPADGAHV
jgi:hypothetical protein